MRLKITLVYALAFFMFRPLQAQLFLNEGTNKSYLTGIDEDGEAEDWIELYNAGATDINLSGYYLSDKVSEPTMWALPDQEIEAGGYMQIYCSEKNRYSSPPFEPAGYITDYVPTTGWNTHALDIPFVWDGVQNIILNICAYNNTGYTENSVFLQTATAYISTTATFNDGSDASCSNVIGNSYYQRPNMQINGFTIGTGVIENSPYDYPAPYGNWYWSSRHQILIRAEEMLAAGLTPGEISSIAFQVASTNIDFYSYIDLALLGTNADALTSVMTPLDGFSNHTSFKIAGEGEIIYLFNNAGEIVSELSVASPVADVTTGRYPDGDAAIVWMEPSPNATNNTTTVFTDTLITPIIPVPTGIVSEAFTVSISNPNTDVVGSTLVYTTDGSTPTIFSTVYTGAPISVNASTVIRAKVLPPPGSNYLPSYDAVATYLFDVDHTTPILLVTTDENNLYGAEGIFDNYNSDWIKAAHLTFLTSEDGHPLLFETRTAMRMDGGAGGSRSNPQHSFRLTFDHAALGEKTIEAPLIPEIPWRTKYSDIYLRNGSNQWLTFPQKDACQVSMMSAGTNNYYSAMEPVSVYINGSYFGLYELREKFNLEYFDERENIDDDNAEILSLSYFYNLILRALEGDVDNFYNSYNAFNALNPSDTDYIAQADVYFDMNHYADYIIGESWMGNTDWPYNNIKIYRSDITNYRWRFALIDLELALNPNGWTNCNYDHIDYMLSQGTDNPYINIWLQSIENPAYKNYFINRYADLLNTSYLTDSLLVTEERFFNKMLPEMPNEYARWGDPFNIDGQVVDFIDRHEVFRQQLTCRNDKVREDLISAFELNKEVSIELSVFPEQAGFIQVNTITPQVYPWTGIYFDGVPISLTAIADTGYTFVNWVPVSYIADTLQASFTANIDEELVSFTAVFKEVEPPAIDSVITFSIYPSPAENVITIAHSPASLTIGTLYEIYAVNGDLLHKGIIDTEGLTTQVSIATLNAGLYFVKISNPDSVETILNFVKL